jgi:hypothetical protein
MGRTGLNGPGGVEQLLVDQAVVAAQQHQGGPPVEHVDEHLDLPVGRRLVLAGQVLDGPDPRRGEPR